MVEKKWVPNFSFNSSIWVMWDHVNPTMLSLSYLSFSGKLVRLWKKSSRDQTITGGYQVPSTNKMLVSPIWLSRSNIVIKKEPKNMTLVVKKLQVSQLGHFCAVAVPWMIIDRVPSDLQAAKAITSFLDFVYLLSCLFLLLITSTTICVFLSLG